MDQLKRKLFELGIATPYVIAEVLAGAFEDAVDNLSIVKAARRGQQQENNDDYIDAEFEVIEPNDPRCNQPFHERSDFSDGLKSATK